MRREVTHVLSSFPVYRHPADESPPLSPFSATVSLIRDHVQKVLLDTVIAINFLYPILGFETPSEPCSYPTLPYRQ